MTATFAVILCALLMLSTLALLSISGTIGQIKKEVPQDKKHFLNMLKIQLSLMQYYLTSSNSKLLNKSAERFLELMKKYGKAYLTNEEIQKIFADMNENSEDKVKTIQNILNFLKSI